MVLSRAQKVTLAVGVPLTAAAIGWGGLNAVAAVGRGTEQVNLRLPVTNGTVAAHLGNGDIRLVQGSGSVATLTGTVRYSLFPPGISKSTVGDRLSVDFNCTSPVGWCGADMALTVPASVTSAELSTDNGNVTVSGPLAANTLSLSSSMGDISASGVTASDVSANSDMGDITLTFTKAPKTLTVSDSMGDISIVLPVGVTYHVVASSDMGSVNDAVQHSDSASDSISVTTNMGDVSITYGS
ncbi:MAG TPA: DUF4097 family beta strand repeat-containing protein [Streptosporangiaceae bacterium]|nr:DUF4097 family beta strand repeat-containing protein [Streptosporangiaceae bacterium]